MPRRELSRPQQIVDWLVEWGRALEEPASMTLIGYGWHVNLLPMSVLKELPEGWEAPCGWWDVFVDLDGSTAPGHQAAVRE